MLAKAVDHKDAKCVELFRRGAPLVGRLPCSGNGTPVAITEVTDEAGLFKGAVASNRRLLESLREDENAKALHEVRPDASLGLLACNWLCAALFKACLKDARLGRMTQPQPASMEMCERCILAPRFSVEQGNQGHNASHMEPAPALLNRPYGGWREENPAH